jgi:hypothetical protein
LPQRRSDAEESNLKKEPLANHLWMWGRLSSLPGRGGLERPPHMKAQNKAE